ncbi:MAG: C4-dicarboxylate ABC transporter [Chryseobacterium sp.]|uniref:C4-dicarboxylate ABC transporter n=1 Tax=Epilithonimonas xixisoli TaxID=1476462 RepID=A0A4R8I325_9FLAO|nr:C4-dicarboxylate ABC transporter [Epilithonimonas xixisoli]MBP7499612.1 C4-dicarboxylate ABC transporter [Chryseobacterium sp.]TDX82654.1 hypothetical protein B0I22_2670 [Epilithonimonas xixisoli]
MFKWLSLLAGFIYIVLGIVVIIYKFFGVVLEPNVAYALGALLIAYGIFRLVRAATSIKNKD